jgi:Malate:quinone oxidoreductase (Mqo)
LRKRFEAMSVSHCYSGMEYTESRAKIAERTPLIMEGRGNAEPFAATRIVTGTDVDYGALTHLLIKHLSAQPGVSMHYKHQVVDLNREHNGVWRVDIEEGRHAGAPRSDVQIRLHRRRRRRHRAAPKIAHPRRPMDMAGSRSAEFGCAATRAR